MLHGKGEEKEEGPPGNGNEQTPSSACQLQERSTKKERKKERYKEKEKLNRKERKKKRKKGRQLIFLGIAFFACSHEIDFEGTTATTTATATTTTTTNDDDDDNAAKVNRAFDKVVMASALLYVFDCWLSNALRCDGRLTISEDGFVLKGNSISYAIC